jgi:hypothetical protein
MSRDNNELFSTHTYGTICQTFNLTITEEVLEKCHAWPDGPQAITITTVQASMATVTH